MGIVRPGRTSLDSPRHSCADDAPQSLQELARKSDHNDGIWATTATGAVFELANGIQNTRRHWCFDSGTSLSLAPSESLKDISFSADRLTQTEVVGLIKEFKSITWCQIVDPQEKLDKEALRKLGNEKGIKIVVKRTGALQDLRRAP